MGDISDSRDESSDNSSQYTDNETEDENEGNTLELCKAMNNTSLKDETVKKLTFSTEKFNGKAFYEKYVTADFLRSKRNIARILSQRKEVINVLDTMKSGEKLVIDGMFIKPGTPLTIRKSGNIDESDMDSYDITYHRLSGLAAAYIWNNIKAFEGVYATEPEAIGIAWTKTPWQRKLYLSAVSGAELFEEFEYIPFICALKKYTLKLMPENMLCYIASKPHSETGEPMAVWFRRMTNEAENYNRKLFLSSHYYSETLSVIMKAAPDSIRTYFHNLNRLY